ncbi:hypothetical protein [Chromatium okenii]|uniref:hypothetical protein n=1 Tax=Chromatium okenii TaxID=61644 RepID=UPI001A929815|nr:hypothetical protein [Chromatium okenii]
MSIHLQIYGKKKPHSAINSGAGFNLLLSGYARKRNPQKTRRPIFQSSGGHFHSLNGSRLAAQPN